MKPVRRVASPPRGWAHVTPRIIVRDPKALVGFLRKVSTTSTAACAVMLAALALPVFVAAQENPLVRDRAGSWAVFPPPAPAWPVELTAQERTAVLLWVHQLFDAAHRAPTLAPPAGFQVIPHAFVSVEALDRGGKGPAHATANLVMNVAPYERMNGKIDANERDSAVRFSIRVNDPGPLRGSEIDLGDEDGTFVENPPESVDTRHGYPVYEEGNLDRWVLIRRNVVPFFIPVTRGRFLAAKLKEADAQVATIEQRRAKMPAGLPASITATVDEALAHARTAAAAMRQSYASMSEADRRKPAILGESDADAPPAFVDAAAGTAVVCINPALMDGRMPRSAPQLLAVSISGDEAISPGAADALDRELDWGALEKMLRQ